MTIHEANELLKNLEVTQSQLLDCLEKLCKEYGYIQGVTVTKFRDLISGKKSLDEIQSLIEQVKHKIKCTN